MSLRIFDVYKFNVVLHFFFILFFSVYFKDYAYSASHSVLALKSKILCFYLFSTFSSLETVQSKRREKALANQEVTSPGSKVSQDNGCTVDKYVLPLGTPCVYISSGVST